MKIIKKEGVRNLYDYFFCILIIVFPYSIKLTNILVILLSLYFIVDYKESKTIDFKRLLKVPLVLLGALVFYWLCKGLATNTLRETKYHLLLPIILVPLLFLKIRDVNKVLSVILISVLMVSARAIYGIFKYYKLYNEFRFFEGESINTMLGLERPYLAFFCLIGIVISFGLAIRFPKFKYWFFAYCISVSIFLFFISARISVLTLIFLAGLYFACYIKIPLKRKVLLFIMLGITLSLVFFLSKGLRERLFITGTIEQSMQKLERHEPRVVIWDCAYNIATRADFNWVFGIDSEEELDNLYASCYDEKLANKHRSNFFITSKLNSHSQFIGTYLTSGIIGLFLMLALFASHLIIYRKDFIKMALITSLLFFFVVEIVLRRQFGAYLFIFVLSIVNVSSGVLEKENKLF